MTRMWPRVVFGVKCEVFNRSSQSEINSNFLSGSKANGDEELTLIANEIFKSGTQIAKHPLSV